MFVASVPQLSASTTKKPAVSTAAKPAAKTNVSTARKPAPSSTTSKARPASSRSATTRTASRKAPAKKAPVVRRSYQSAPTAERYKEIQQALVDRGYFRGEPDGTWGPDSIEALKRFQQEQNLAPSGKLDSVSLIALGLGPKRNLAARAGPDLNTLPRPQDDNRRSQGSERP